MMLYFAYVNFTALIQIEAKNIDKITLKEAKNVSTFKLSNICSSKEVKFINVCSTKLQYYEKNCFKMCRFIVFSIDYRMCLIKRNNFKMILTPKIIEKSMLFLETRTTMVVVKHSWE